MKKIYVFLFACLLSSMLSAQGSKELYILHTNDTHSRIEPYASSSLIHWWQEKPDFSGGLR